MDWREPKSAPPHSCWPSLGRVKTVRYTRDGEWEVLGQYRSGGIDGELVLARGELGLVPAVEMKAALRRRADDYGSTSEVALVFQGSDEYLDTEGPYEDVWFEWAEGQLLLGARYWVDYPNDEPGYLATVHRLLETGLVAIRSTLRVLEIDDGYSNSAVAGVRLSLAVPWVGKTAADLFEAAADAIQLCSALSDGAITRSSAKSLLRGGAARLLIGQPESSWLEAKSEEYDLTSLHGKLRISQAVAKFCNAEAGGLIVVGAKAKKTLEGEVIQDIRGIPAERAGTPARYLQVLDHHIYPLPVGLTIEAVPADTGRVLIAIDVPPQPEHMKPFLVWGAITPDGRIEGAFISIVQRRGEASVPTTAAAIHSAIAAGRAVLRGRHGTASD